MHGVIWGCQRASRRVLEVCSKGPRPEVLAQVSGLCGAFLRSSSRQDSQKQSLVRHFSRVAFCLATPEAKMLHGMGGSSAKGLPASFSGSFACSKNGLQDRGQLCCGDVLPHAQKHQRRHGGRGQGPI